MNNVDRFSRSQKLLLFVVLLLNLSTFGLLVYRFSLPTDGWLAVEPDGFEDRGFVYQQNVLGVGMMLQPGDWVTAVNDISVENALFSRPDLLDLWQEGNTVQYTVRRGEQTLRLDVALTRWSAQKFLNAMFSDLGAVFSLLGTTVFVAVSYFAFWRRPNDPAAQGLLLLASTLFSLILIFNVLPQMLPDLIYPVTNLGLSTLITAMFTILLPPAFIRFGLVFPRPKPTLLRHPWLGYIPFLVGAGITFVFVRGTYAVGWLWTGTAVMITILLLLHNAFTMRDMVSLGQLRWAVGGILLGLGLFSLTYVNIVFVNSASLLLAQILSSLSNLGFAVMGIGLAVAVLRYHLFEIDLIVNRALVYGGLTICVLAIYVLVVGYLGFLFQTEANLYISLTATGLVAVLFGWLQRWLQQGVNRLMYGQRDEPYLVLTRLGQQVQAALEPSAAFTLTVATIAQALKLPYVAIRLKAGLSFQTVAECGSVRKELITFPIVNAGEVIGELAVASRSPHEQLTPADIRLLNDLVGQISSTVHAMQLAQELEQARLHIVSAREEARRQLGNDLHDGVGHQLTGLVRQVEQARRIMVTEPTSLSPLLDDINGQLNNAITVVRQLAYQLHPPELELLGLAGAIREQAESSHSLMVQLNMPSPLPTLPAAIETVVYYITLEAFTNIDKHANARNVKFCLQLSEDPDTLTINALSLEIEDDGQGLKERSGRGLGLLSMQARAAEVGGVCDIESTPTGGTCVRVRLPLPLQVG